LGFAARLGILVATVLVIIAFAVLPLLTPWFMHAALDAAGAADRLGLSEAQVHALSDQTVRELVLGPGDFAFSGPDGQPFYDADERGHMGDARLVLGLFLVAGGISLAALAGGLVRWQAKRIAIWAAIRRSGLLTSVVVIVLGFISLVAFDSLFELFHRVFFPGGNWAFDPSTQRLVQLYPFRFWQIAAAMLGTLVFLLGLITWLLGRWMSRDPASDSTPNAREV
jgi:integral membrane protein (TIGR01906 family)